jgi:hypothetical protein
VILLWGLPGDRPLAAVYESLRRSGRPVVLLDQRTVLDTSVDLCVDDQITGLLRTRGRTVELEAVTAAYVRPHDSRRLPCVRAAGDESAAWLHAISVEDALVSWAQLTPALVVNRPDAMAANGSKPHQGALIEAHGLRVPDTLITTDPVAALDFWERHGDVVYKSLSGIRSIVSRLAPEDLDRLDDVVWCPTQFQQYIAGDDYRVHVVGDDLFACRIATAADDYRYAGADASVSMRTYDLPADVAGSCVKLATAMDLPVAGLDLRRSSDGAWYCFEVNPSPGFTYFQESTGQPIDASIARFLADAGSDGPSRSGCRPAGLR